MKSKRINILERHVEKLFFLVAVIALLGVLFMQFAAGGMKVKVGSKDGLTITQAYDRISKDALQIEGQIKANERDSRAPSKAPGVTNMLTALVDASNKQASPITPLGIPDSGTFALNDTGQGGDARQGDRYAMPNQPSPSTPLVAQYADAIDPIMAVQVPALEAYLPDAQPFDLQFTSVAATFDAKALRDAFTKDPDGTGPAIAIPRHWWQGQLVLLDVELWRQRIDSSGAPGAEELIEPMPGAGSLRGQLGDNMNMQQILEAANTETRAITRPDFFPIIAGQPWVPPAAPIQQSAQEIKAFEQLAILDRLTQDIDDAIAEREAIGDRGNRTSRRNNRNQNDAFKDVFAASAGVGGRGRGGRGAGQDRSRPSGASAAERDRKRTETRIAAIQERIDRLEDERSEVIAWFSENGLDPDAIVEVNAGQRLLDSDPGTLKESDQVNVWAHDLSVEQGVIYRYRLRLVYGNPFFGRENVLAEDQREPLAGSRVLHSEFSPWSEPTTIDQQNYFFLTAAGTSSGSIDQTRTSFASAELYSFFYGHWRRAELRLTTGDPIVSELPVPGLSIFEFAPDAGANAAPEFGEIPLDETLTRSLDAVLLDIRPSARLQRDALKGGRTTKVSYEVVVLGADDSISIRQPENDRSSDLRRRLRESAKLAADAEILTPGSGGVFTDLADKQDNPTRDTGASRDREQDRGGLGGRDR